MIEFDTIKGYIFLIKPKIVRYLQVHINAHFLLLLLQASTVSSDFPMH